jgi:hypothetical protein
MAEKPINARNLVTVASALLLVGVEMFGAALAAGWAIAGLFQLGDSVGYALMALFALGAAYAMLVFGRRVLSVEPIRS